METLSINNHAFMTVAIFAFNLSDVIPRAFWIAIEKELPASR